MRKSEFIKHLEHLEEQDLREELLMLYDKLKEVREHYKIDLGSAKDRERVLLKAKKDIASKYATKSYRRPRRPRIQKVNVLLKELEKKGLLDFEMIDIYLHNTECGVYLMKEYRFHSQVLYNAIIKSFNKALLMIQGEGNQADIESRCQMILDDIKDLPALFDFIIPEYIQTFDQGEYDH